MSRNCLLQERRAPSMRFEAASWVEAHVRTALEERDDVECAVAIARRSPLGAHAVRLHPSSSSAERSNATCRDLSEWVRRQAWALAVADRPPHVYFQVTTAALLSWVVAGLSGRAARLLSSDESRRAGLVRFVDPAVNGSRRLEHFREAAVGRSIQALFAANGYDVSTEPNLAADTHCVELKLAAGTESTDDFPMVTKARVEGIDLPQGALRARCGGTVSSDDVLTALRTEWNLLGADAPNVVVDTEDLLRYFLLTTERTRRIQLTDTKLQLSCATFAALLGTRQLAGERATRGRHAENWTARGDADAAREQALRDLALELDPLESIVARAASELEPSHLVRYVQNVADRARAASGHLIGSDPLSAAVANAINSAISLIGISAPRPAPSFIREAAK
jgi:arginyl-tRNA synthetase